MNKQRKKWRFVLWPFSLVYGFITGIRNIFFEWGLLKSVEFPVPVISVGNITVGGTGKTPHIEYLAEQLHSKIETAILSRGYRRKTRGFLLVTSTSTPDEAGDEPCQMKQKFPGMTVAVDRSRVHGITQLMSRFHDMKAILLDDAFQHRYVKPALNILLVDYHRLITRDYMLPAGDLREAATNRYRAHIMIVTKCPAILGQDERAAIEKELDPLPSQDIFFTAYQYDDPVSVFPAARNLTLDEMKKNKGAIFLVTGIANPAPLKFFVQDVSSHTVEFTFPDHHAYSRKDLEKVMTAFMKEEGKGKVVITTEKDAIRLRQVTIPESIQSVLYYIPIRVKFLFDGKDIFDRKIHRYVGTN